MLYLTGDVHGDALDLMARAEAVRAGEGDEVLVLGDVGFAYGRSEADGLPLVTPFMAQLMRHAAWRLVVLRGNHDNRYERDLLARQEGEAIGLGHAAETEWRGGRAFTCSEFPNVVFLPDAGGLYDIDGVTTLVAPGAFSIDGELRRRRGWAFEPEEQLTAGERRALLELADGAGVEVVLSHTCPLSWQGWMGDLLADGVSADNSMERSFGEMLETVRPTLRRWAFGHYHADRPVGGGLGRLMYLDIADFGSVVSGDTLGTARGDYSARNDWKRGRALVERFIGAPPASELGYTTAELCDLVGCGPDLVERVMRHQPVAIDPKTREPLVMPGDVARVVRAAWRR